MAARQLFHRGGAMLLGDLARRLAVEVEALRARCGQRLEVGAGGGVAREEDAQRALAEHARGAGLDVGLDAQLDRLEGSRRVRADEQRREQLGQARAAGRGRQLDRGRGAACGRFGSRRILCRRISHGCFSNRCVGNGHLLRLHGQGIGLGRGGGGRVLGRAARGWL
jgi:hypothetical protein